MLRQVQCIIRLGNEKKNWFQNSLEEVQYIFALA